MWSGQLCSEGNGCLGADTCNLAGKHYFCCFGCDYNEHGAHCMQVCCCVEAFNLIIFYVCQYIATVLLTMFAEDLHMLHASLLL